MSVQFCKLFVTLNLCINTSVHTYSIPLVILSTKRIVVQSRRAKWKTFSVQALYDMILDGALVKMREIANSVVSEMKAMGVIRTIGTERV